MASGFAFRHQNATERMVAIPFVDFGRSQLLFGVSSVRGNLFRKKLIFISDHLHIVVGVCVVECVILGACKKNRTTE